MTSRRHFLADLSRLAAVAAVAPNAWRLDRRARFADDPFQLGVASGQPTPTGGVLWTRLAPRPFEPEGGMEGLRVVVDWELAEDEGFQRVRASGRVGAVPELGYSIHAEPSGLAPDRWYFYRFTAGEARSPVGRFRTAPAEGATTPLRMAVASCQHYEQGLFTAHGHLAAEEIDLVAHLGDYIYEYAGAEGRVRKHHGLEIRTVEDYRRRYAQYKLDPLLQRAHARAPWIVTWDDHEVDNNYAGTVGENRMESVEQMRTRRAAAYQAWWEHMPVSLPRPGSWADLAIHQSIGWGALARLWVLDTRQYRDDQPCGDGTRAPCEGWDRPDSQVLGPAQEGWLQRGLASSRARWQVLAQQIMMAPYDSKVGEGIAHSMDQWSGYPGARDRLLRTLGTHAGGRAIVLSGDIHTSWVNELRRGFDRPDRPLVGAEFVGTSISSGGDGADSAELFARMRPDNPHLHWHDRRRGYMLCTVTPDEWRTDYRIVPFVSRPDAPVETRSRWRVAHGRPVIEAV